MDYLVDYLSADTTLMGMVNGIFMRSVPTSAPMPVVKLDVVERSDLMVVDLYRVWSDLGILVRAAAENTERDQPDWSEVRAIADRLDALLHKHEATTSELEIHSYREEPFSDETIEDSKLYLHAGGIYRVRAHAV